MTLHRCAPFACNATQDTEPREMKDDEALSSDWICALGRTGIACGWCKEGWARSGLGCDNCVTSVSRVHVSAMSVCSATVCT
jgi:hypothetical protein